MTQRQKVNVKLNGVDIQTVVRLATAIDTDPARAQELAGYTRGCRVRWTDGFRSQAYTRDVPQHGFDEPTWLGGTNAAMAASEALLGAIGGCIATGFAANASLRDVEIRELEVAIEGEIDIPSFLGLRDSHSGYKQVRITIFVDADADHDLLQEIAYRAVELSPVVNTIRNPVAVEYTLKDIR